MSRNSAKTLIGVVNGSLDQNVEEGICELREAMLHAEHLLDNQKILVLSLLDSLPNPALGCGLVAANALALEAAKIDAWYRLIQDLKQRIKQYRVTSPLPTVRSPRASSTVPKANQSQTSEPGP